MNTETRSVTLCGKPLALPDLSYELLIKLVEIAPLIASAQTLAREVWQLDYVSDETIAKRIALLRKALGDDPKAPSYVRTVRGAGYSLVAKPALIDARPAPQRVPKIAAAATGVIMLTALAILAPKILDGSVATVPPVDDRVKSTVAILIERADEQLRAGQAQATERAISMLRDAVTQDPENSEARLLLSFALSTKTTKYGGGAAMEQEAEAIARAILDEQPDNSRAWSALAYSLGSQGRLSESLSAYEYAFELDPYNTAAISSAAHTHLVQGDIHGALSLDLRAKQMGGATRYSEVQIAHALELIDHPGAQGWFDRALSLNPAQIVVLSEVARSYLRQAKPEAALTTLQRLEGRDGDSPQLAALRGRAALTIGDIKRAQAYLTASAGAGHFDRAALNAMNGDTTEAAAILSPASLMMYESDTWPPTRVRLAEVAASLGREDQAIAFLIKAINLGWRDIKWLKQSPFLRDVMASPRGFELETRIKRELHIQTKRVEANEALVAFLNAGQRS